MTQTASRARGRDAFLWFLLVVVTFGGLIVLAYAAFASTPPTQVLVATSTAAELGERHPTIRQSLIAEQIPETARDVRIVWRPATDEFAGAWHGDFDPAAYADCPVVASPERPDFASRIVRVGEAAFEAFECEELVIARVGSTTFAWSR
ncbi:hypothetical protein [Agromyces aerolatus]|uniref:hypothetical protein n=1 Tax=Agromyces sp. LY-1074 TaxID=3074080 RepID=UPI00285551DA|nr:MULTISPECIES: hypothetical protein [unclassified Agromyces]MDR5698457.1 hypothetical protein [Agromyces sp. LY-1074]MDR5704751.1 hypothetical protein [Agromyces sp. LY-1358]